MTEGIPEIKQSQQPDELHPLGPDGQEITTPEQMHQAIQAAATEKEDEVSRQRQESINKQRDAWDKLHGLQG